ncbi:MAG: hypothetical protein DRH90_18895 [Deltaproteobacteria bacterium]|nr:MAG: hypothetical protein DRH90_18895 [Deltaproteobacteria bacterium]RLC12469.1 MAG: hypothetical protein DRI24_17335 [Deltaproteobacteria bacterium]
MFLQKKTAPQNKGGAMLNRNILTLFIANASYLFFLEFFLLLFDDTLFLPCRKSYFNGLAITSKSAYCVLSIKSRSKLAGMFLSVGIVRLLNVIILQFATLKFFERRMIL